MEFYFVTFAAPTHVPVNHTYQEQTLANQYKNI